MSPRHRPLPCVALLPLLLAACAPGPRQVRTDVTPRVGLARLLHVDAARAEKQARALGALRVRHTRPHGAYFEGELSYARIRLLDAEGASAPFEDLDWAQLAGALAVGYGGRFVASQVGVTLLFGGLNGVQPVPSIAVRVGPLRRFWAALAAGCEAGLMEPCGFRAGVGLRVSRVTLEQSAALSRWPGSVPVTGPSGRRNRPGWVSTLLGPDALDPTSLTRVDVQLAPRWALSLTYCMGESVAASAGVRYRWSGPAGPPGRAGRPAALPPPLSR